MVVVAVVAVVVVVVVVVIEVDVTCDKPHTQLAQEATRVVVLPHPTQQALPACRLVAGVSAQQVAQLGPHVTHVVAALLEVIHHACCLQAEVGGQRDDRAHNMVAAGDDVELAALGKQGPMRRE